ncbi:hypothetical protein [Solidesulfovibrio sp.]
MKRALVAASTLCLLLAGSLFAFARTAPGESYAAFADAASGAGCCEMVSCGCLGTKCSCFECGGGK